jgi:hypothetical protein
MCQQFYFVGGRGFREDEADLRSALGPMLVDEFHDPGSIKGGRTMFADDEVEIVPRYAYECFIKLRYNFRIGTTLL